MLASMIICKNLSDKFPARRRTTARCALSHARAHLASIAARELSHARVSLAYCGCSRCPSLKKKGGKEKERGKKHERKKENSGCTITLNIPRASYLFQPPGL